jgi:hypothetical protein
MLPDIYGLEAWAKKRERRLVILGFAIVITFALLGCGLIIKAWQNTVAYFEVPDLAVCSLEVVDCGEWEPVTPAPTRVPHDGVASYYDYVLKSGWSSVGHHVCASRMYKRGTRLVVTELESGEYFQTYCLVTDYGPDAAIHPDRIIDLSSTSFNDLAPLKMGTIKVRVQVEGTL